MLVGELRSESTAPVTEAVAADDTGLAAGAASDDPAASVAGDRTVLQMAVVGDPIFDPMRVSVVDPQQMALVDLVTDGLTEWDPQRNTWAPALAAGIQTTDDGRTWRFELASTAAFSDGSPVEAHDVVRSFQRVMADSFSLPATRLEIVQSVAAVGDRSVEFVLDEPFAQFPALVSSPVYGVVPDGPLDGTVGSGPFAIDDAGALVSSGGAVAFELVSVDDETAAVAAFEAGEVDIAYVSAAYDGVVSTSVTAAVEVHFALNAASPELAELETRRMVVDAVSRTRVTSEVFGAGAGAIGRMIPAALACAAPCGGVIPEEPVEVGPLRVAYVVDPSGREAALADSIVTELVAAGVPASAEGFSLDEFVAHVSSGEHDLVRTGWVGLFPSADSQLSPYRSSSPDNVSGYASAAFDELLAAARTSGGDALYSDAQAMVQDEAVVLPIARLRVRALVSDRIASIELRHDGSIDLDSLRLAD